LNSHCEKVPELVHLSPVRATFRLEKQWQSDERGDIHYFGGSISDPYNCADRWEARKLMDLDSDLGWLHLASELLFPRICVYIFVGIFLATSLLQFNFIICRNWQPTVDGRSLPQAVMDASYDRVQIYLILSRPLRVKVGQHIGLWAPVSFGSFWQSHPFVVTSWSEGAQSILDLFIESRKGFTQKLL
jgi:hypothetical protein